MRCKKNGYTRSFSPYRLFLYHQLIMDEMKRRGYRITELWLDKNYRGTKCPAYDDLEPVNRTGPIYPEHNRKYYKECLHNLAEKGIILSS